MDDNNKTKEQLIAELAQMQKRIAVLEESEIECKRVADALNVAQRYTRGLIEANLDALVTISAKGKITDVNITSEMITGMSRKEIVGTDFSNYFTDPDAARKGYQQVFRDGYVRDYPLEIKHRDGRVTPVLYNASVYKDAQGNVAGVFAAARDITESKKVEKELMGNLKDLQQFKEVTVDRENVMIGLKKEVNKLCEELEKPEKYNLSFLDE